MTGKQNPLEDRRIAEMLRESGLEDATELGDSLAELRAFTRTEAPEPRAELAALMTPSVSSLERRRWTHRHRTAALSVAVVGAMGLGAGAVAAANEDFRESVGQTVGVILRPSGQQGNRRSETQPAAPSPSPSNLPAAPGGTNGVVIAPVPASAAPEVHTTAPAAVTPSAVPTSPTPRDEHSTKPTDPAVDRGKGNGTVDGKNLPVLPLPAKPNLPGVLPTQAPGRP